MLAVAVLPAVLLSSRCEFLLPLSPTYVSRSLWRARTRRQDNVMHLIMFQQLLYLADVHGIIVKHQRSDCNVMVTHAEILLQRAEA